MLIERVDQKRLEFSPMLDPKKRSSLGQLMTLGRIARQMAGMFETIPSEVRLLDAGAGMGSLTAAFVTEACRRPEKPRSIDVTCCEVDRVLRLVLDDTLTHCADLCRANGVAFTSRIVEDDYILHS